VKLTSGIVSLLFCAPYYGLCSNDVPNCAQAVLRKVVYKVCFSAKFT